MIESTLASFGGATGPRRAVIDIGSNTVRLVVYGGSARAPTVLWNEKVAARLGREVADTGRLADDSMELALAGLARYATLLQANEVEEIETVATAAVRDASNGSEFLASVARLGLSPRLLSVVEEAEIGALGVLGAFPQAEGVVADLGGGSIELTEVGPEGIKGGVSLPLGSLRLAKWHTEGPEAIRSRVDKVLGKAGWVRQTGRPLYLVGGTFRSMATFALRTSNPLLDDPHGYELPATRAAKLARQLTRGAPEDFARMPGISQMRAAVLPGAGAMMLALIDDLQPDRLVFSSWGLREGLLYRRLDPAVRREDPFLSGLASFCAPRGGQWELAARVAEWAAPAIGADCARVERVRLGATILALALTQVEPNLRAPQALNWALHKRWIAIDASDRAVLATALLASCNALPLPEGFSALADTRALDAAVSWGLAVRLCRRLAACAPVTFEQTRLEVEGGCLTLVMTGAAAVLRNKGVEKDLDRLGQALDLDTKIVVDEKGAVPLSRTG